MNVYYDASLWHNGKGRKGRPQKVDWKFKYGKTEYVIPMLYRFPKGLVFDIHWHVDPTHLQTFLEKYGVMEEQLFVLQERCASQEHPYQKIPLQEIWVQGVRVEVPVASSDSWSAEKVSPACERVCVPYPKTSSWIQKFLRFFSLAKITDLKIVTAPTRIFSPIDLSFTLFCDKSCQSIEFHHPTTKKVHTLHFQEFEILKIPAESGIDSSCRIVQAAYEIEPELLPQETLEFSLDYRQVPSNEATAIGFIGSSKGATSIFVSSESSDFPRSLGMHGLPLYGCVFSLNSTHSVLLEGISSCLHDEQEFVFSV